VNIFVLYANTFTFQEVLSTEGIKAHASKHQALSFGAEAIGRAKKPKAPELSVMNRDKVNLTDKESRFISVSGSGDKI